MSYVNRVKASLTTAADGTLTTYTDPVQGLLLHSIEYVKTDFDNGVDFTVTEEDTGKTLWAESDVNATASRYPRAATHSTAGVASVYAAGGAAVNDQIPIVGRIKIVIAQGGNAKTGTLYFYFA